MRRTAEDFARASFARHPGTGATACRVAGANGGPAWTTEDLSETTDEIMAASGWVPVVEATDVMQHRQIDAEAHLDQIERLSKRASAAEDQIESQRLVLEDLREENDRLERILQAPLSLKDMEVAWEAAEVPTDDAPIREGDTVIVRNPDPEEFSVFTWPGYGYTPDEETRILSRAQREPWVELAGVLHDEAPKGVVDVDHLAERLHAAGVRVTGGEES